MFSIRPARLADRESLAALVHARAAWMQEKGIRGGAGWARNAGELAEQAGDPAWPVWVLTAGTGEIVGRTTVGDQSPEWCWTEQERSEPAIFLSTTVTHPSRAGEQLGYLIARWALDYAARRGMRWVRRGTGPDPGLVRYYCDVQGWHVVRSVERGDVTAWALTRRAELQPGLSQVLNASWTEYLTEPAAANQPA